VGVGVFNLLVVNRGSAVVDSSAVVNSAVHNRGSGVDCGLGDMGGRLNVALSVSAVMGSCNMSSVMNSSGI